MAEGNRKGFFFQKSYGRAGGREAERKGGGSFGGGCVSTITSRS